MNKSMVRAAMTEAAAQNIGQKVPRPLEQRHRSSSRANNLRAAPPAYPQLPIQNAPAQIIDPGLPPYHPPPDAPLIPKFVNMIQVLTHQDYERFQDFYQQEPSVAAVGAQIRKPSAIPNPIRARPLHLTEPPNGGFGLTSGFECRGVSALIDTGASVSLVESSVATQIKAKVQTLDRAQLDLIRTAEGDPMYLIGYIIACLVVGNVVYPHRFYVRGRRSATAIPLTYEMIIGLDLLDKIGHCTVDFTRRELTLRDPVGKSAYTYKFDPRDGNRLIVRCHAGKTWTMGSTTELMPTPRIPQLTSPNEASLRLIPADPSTSTVRASDRPANRPSTSIPVRKAPIAPRKTTPPLRKTPAARGGTTPRSTSKTPSTDRTSRTETAARTAHMATLYKKYGVSDSSASSSKDTPSPSVRTISAVRPDEDHDESSDEDWDILVERLNEERPPESGVG
jgi:hypothetical protein